MRAVVAGILEQQGKVLVAQRLRPAWAAGQWEFPGGRVTEGLSPQAALARHWHEVFGVSVRAGPLLYEARLDTPLGPFAVLAWGLDLLDGEISVQQHRAVAWVAGSELARLPLVQGQRPIVDALFGAAGQLPVAGRP